MRGRGSADRLGRRRAHARMFPHSFGIVCGERGERAAQFEFGVTKPIARLVYTVEMSL